MYDPTIHAKTLARHFKSTDFQRDRALLAPGAAAAKIQEALLIRSAGFGAVGVHVGRANGKPVYNLPSLPAALILRLISENVRRVTSVKQSDRKYIVNCLLRLLHEGTAFQVYKLDIKSFYESVRVPELLKKLSSDLAFSPQSVRLLGSFFDRLDLLRIPGLPRGIGLSATLAEYLLRSFDSRVSTNTGVWYYSRFVDDIIVITDHKFDPTEFMQIATTWLPSGLRFNEKSKAYTFKGYLKGTPKQLEDEFPFLGYAFRVGNVQRKDNLLEREVAVDLASSKVRKIKTRLAKALLDFRSNADFLLLRDRVRLLTSNFNFTDSSTGVRRVSGIYFNYPLISHVHSTALPELDRFLRLALTSPHRKNKLRPTLTKAQRLELLGLTFTAGFRDRRFFAFKPDRLAEIVRCWTYA